MSDVYGKKKMSSPQLMYSVALFIIATNSVVKAVYVYSENQGWLAVLIATVAGLLLVAIYEKLSKNYLGHNLFEINEKVFGVIGGKLLTCFYLFFFMSLVVLNTRDLGGFVSSFVLPATPINIIYAMFLLVCAYAVRKGADKMTRYSTFIFFVFIIMVVLITVLLIPQMHLNNLMPAFTVPLKKQLISAHLVTMLPFGEIIAFMMMIPYMEKPELEGKALRRGLLIGSAVLIVLVVRSTVVMGDYGRMTSNPIFLTVRLINVGDILTRLDIINAVLQIVLLFFKTSILLYAFVTALGSLFNIKNSRIFILIACVFVIVSANSFFNSSYEHALWQSAAPTYSTFFLFILPLVTLIVSEIKRRLQANNGQDTGEDLSQ